MMQQQQREWILFAKWKYQFHVVAFGPKRKMKKKKRWCVSLNSFIVAMCVNFFKKK